MSNKPNGENIVFGKRYKYKDICAIMGENEKPGKGRELQLTKWRKEYQIDKIRSEYIFVKKYNQEEMMYNADKDNMSSYFYRLIVNHLIENNNQPSVMSKREIYETMWMVNNNYFPVKYRQKEVNLDLTKDYDADIGKYNVDMFYNRSEAVFKEILDRAIEKLEDANLVFTKNTYLLYYKNGKSYDRHICTDREISILLDISAEALRECGCKRKNELYAKGHEAQRKYYDHMAREIKKTFGCDSYARAYEFIPARSLDKMVKFTNMEFNDKMCQRLLTSKRMKTAVLGTINEQLVHELIEKK